MINLFKKYDYNSIPFPHVICSEIFSELNYSDLVNNFPSINLFQDLSNRNPNKFKKYSLSKRNNREEFLKFLKSNHIYKKLHQYICSEKFKKILVEDFLKKEINIDFGIKVEKKSLSKKIIKDIFSLNFPIPEQELEIVMEFSSLPFDGGFLAPHNDGQDKLASIVIPIISDEEEALFTNSNGATVFLKTKDPNKSFNIINNTYSFEEVEILKNIDFKKNKFLIFFKTYNSLHAVYPLTKKSDSNLFRNSITINIEKKYKI